MRKYLLLVLVIACLMSLSGCTVRNAGTKTFSSNGMEITLTDEFKEVNDGYLTLYTDEVKVVIIANPVSSIGNISLDEYAKMLADSMEFVARIDGDELKDIIAFEYSVDGEGFVASKSLLALFKNEDYYYHVTFSCAEENYESNKSLFITWLQSIVVK